MRAAGALCHFCARPMHAQRGRGRRACANTARASGDGGRVTTGVGRRRGGGGDGGCGNGGGRWGRVRWAGWCKNGQCCEDRRRLGALKVVAREHDEKLAKLGDRGAHAYRSHANCCPTATLGDRRKTGAPWADRCGNCEKEPSASACCSDLRVGRVAKHPKTSRAPGSGERTGNGERDREGAG